MNGEVVWLTCGDGHNWTETATSYSIPVRPSMRDLLMNAGMDELAASSTPMPRKVDHAIAWLRERKRYCLDQKQPRIVPVVKPTLLDQWLAGRKL